MQLRTAFRCAVVALIVTVPPTAGCHNLFRKADLQVRPAYARADAPYANRIGRPTRRGIEQRQPWPNRLA